LRGVAGGSVGLAVEQEEGGVLEERVGGAGGELHAWRRRFSERITEHIGTRTTSEVGQSEYVVELFRHSVLTPVFFLRLSERVGFASGGQWKCRAKRTGRGQRLSTLHRFIIRH